VARAPRSTAASRCSPGAQVQVDWGDEDFVDTPEGPVHVWSFT
jgi:hypothetical protein